MSARKIINADENGCSKIKILNSEERQLDKYMLRKRNYLYTRAQLVKLCRNRPLLVWIYGLAFRGFLVGNQQNHLETKLIVLT